MRFLIVFLSMMFCVELCAYQSRVESGCCEDARAVQQGCHFLVPDSILVSGEKQALLPRSGALRGTQYQG